MIKGSMRFFVCNFDCVCISFDCLCWNLIKLILSDVCVELSLWCTDQLMLLFL